MDSQFRLQIELDNDIFFSNPTIEIARILKDLARKIEDLDASDLSMYQNLKDINGNCVGTYAIKTNEYLKRS